MKTDLISQLRARGYDVHLRHEYKILWDPNASGREWRTRHEIEIRGAGGYEVWYIRSPDPMRTVATVRSEGGAEATAIATVSPKDQFCRKRGRQIAIGRALKQLGTSFKRLEIRP